MQFSLALGLQPGEASQTANQPQVFERTAVRAVIRRGPALLLVLTLSGDYKFPGGGVAAGESPSEALQREVSEETGYRIDSVGDCLGTVVERMPDSLEPGAVFCMTSCYYPATLTGEPTEQRLDEYEAALGFQPVWIEPAAALAANEALLLANKAANRWVYRETLVLRALAAGGHAGASQLDSSYGTEPRHASVSLQA